MRCTVNASLAVNSTVKVCCMACLRLDALGAAGCHWVHEDRISGATFTRAGLDCALTALQPGGELVVWKLDRLGRSMLDTVKRGVGFRSRTESFDTKTPLGRSILALLAAVAEYEREWLRERTQAGMQAMARRGAGSMSGGRP